MRTNGIGALSALVAALFLAGCGGGSDGGNDFNDNAGNTTQANIKEVVSFGDSLNDVGTYNPTTSPGLPASGYNYAGLPFTTKPGNTWASYVALQYNFLLLPYERVDFGIPKSVVPTGTGQVVLTGGTSYAQGGATVQTDDINGPGGVVTVTLPGYGPTPVQEATQLSVKKQIDTYLASRSSFNAHQLILVDGGANDILNFLSGLSTNPANAANATAVVTAAATGMVTQLQRLVAAGATNIVYVNVPDIGTTPFATMLLASANPQLPALATQMSTGYNQAVAAGIANTKIITFDTAAMLKNVQANMSQYGMVNVNSPACNAKAQTSTTDPTSLTSLICSTATLVAPGADSNYLFADYVHPTNGAHKIWAGLVMQQILPSIPK
ncbi:SGNH/GDSL hydrolase family protein [Silvimonas sp.]|uniref:SGNH/GDSL hydrolase family protein n=1 Tax=Silvimonas sp. TaxID=2650811 RepID=UPI00283BB5AF|nr:SGNH/GDSL hydrolase family protein [Silvimonas sp.]MDR3426335.1 SGNH/GDSL hydrolase family protein [Silvimonas sp.]